MLTCSGDPDQPCELCEPDHELAEARAEASWWREIAWMEGYPRDSDDRHNWETLDEYRTILANPKWSLARRPERHPPTPPDTHLARSNR